MIDIAKAETFMATHARLLDRRRVDVLLGHADSDALLAQLAPYRNPDGGFGWGLEADQRAPSSQLAGALHAFELLEESATASPMGAALCDWLAGVELPGGGVPFSLPGAAAPGTAPWWAGASTETPSLHITAAILSHAYGAAAHDPAIASHPWLARTLEWCLERIAALDRPEGGYELAYSLQLLDAVADARADARVQLERLVALVPDGAELAVHGGVESETLHLLDFAVAPNTPLRRLLPTDAIERQLDAVAAGQHDDGGWTVRFPSSSPAGALEWRGVATLRALHALKLNGRI